MDRLTDRLGQSGNRADVGVYDFGGGQIVVKCDQCGCRWSPNIRPESGGQFCRGWRKCPNGCNADKLSN